MRIWLCFFNEHARNNWQMIKTNSRYWFEEMVHFSPTQGNNFQVTKTCNKISELLSCDEANFGRQQINKLGQKKQGDFGSLWLPGGVVVDNEAPICTTVLSRIRTKQMLLQFFFNSHNNISYTDSWTTLLKLSLVCRRVQKKGAKQNSLPPMKKEKQTP